MFTEKMKKLLIRISDLCYQASEEVYEDERMERIGVLNLCNDLQEAIDKYLKMNDYAMENKEGQLRETVIKVIEGYAPGWIGNEALVENVMESYDDSFDFCHDFDDEENMINGFYKDAIIAAINGTISDYEEGYIEL